MSRSCDALFRRAIDLSQGGYMGDDNEVSATETPTTEAAETTTEATTEAPADPVDDEDDE